MAQTDKKAKKGRGPTKLSFLTYPRIAKLTGYAMQTVWKYANRGDFDARDLESCLIWINERRKSKGWELIGIPGKAPELPNMDTSENETVDVTPLPVVDCGCSSDIS